MGETQNPAATAETIPDTIAKPELPIGVRTRLLVQAMGVLLKRANTAAADAAVQKVFPTHPKDTAMMALLTLVVRDMTVEQQVETLSKLFRELIESPLLESFTPPLG